MSRDTDLTLVESPDPELSVQFVGGYHCDEPGLSASSPAKYQAFFGVGLFFHCCFCHMAVFEGSHTWREAADWW